MKTGPIKIQLSSMMFIQYFIWGAWYVTLGAYLNKNVFVNGGPIGGVEIGLAYGTMAIASMISPFIIGMIADRFFSANRVMAFLNFVGGGLMFWLSTINDFHLFFPILLLYAICYMPTVTLSNSISFANLNDPGKEFSRIRLLGSFGWIISGLFVSFLNIEDTNLIFHTAGIVSIIGGVLALTLPYKAPEKGEKASFASIIGLDALGLMKQNSFLILFIFSVLTCIPLAFYDSFTSLYLQQSGIANIAAAMSLGQVAEVIFLFTFPFFFAKLRYKGSIGIAILVWMTLYGFFALGHITGNEIFLYSALPFHGFCFTFFFVSGQLFVEEKAPSNLKNSAQGLIAFATYGLGKWLGTFISGNVTEHYKLADGTYDWTPIWVVPLVIITLVFIGFMLFFNEKDNRIIGKAKA